MSCVDISDIIVYYFAIVILMACECVYIMYDQGVINKCELFFTAKVVRAKVLSIVL